MTRRAGGADSRPADRTAPRQHHRHHTAPRRRACEQKRQIPARPRAARSTAQPAQSVPIGQHRTAQPAGQRTARHTADDETRCARAIPRAGNPLDAPRSAREQYRARREANPRTRHGGTRGHLGRGRPTHKRSIFKPGYCTHGLFIASAFGYPYSVAQ